MSLHQVSTQAEGNVHTSKLELEARTQDDPEQFLDVHVVVLNNYFRMHHVATYQELAKRVRKLTILLSVPMEPDREWDANWADLDVRIQKNWMWIANWRHSAGFKEANFIHVPIDTVSQLKSLKPDIVFSYEMGMRTLLASWYRRFHRGAPLVMVGNMSEHIEMDRGLLRRSFRWLVKKGVDYFTYNGPSCLRYLKSLAISDERLFHLPYCIDPETVYRGERKLIEDSNETPRRLFYGGAISERKGILQFASALQRWCNENPHQHVELTIGGSGDLQESVAACSAQNLATTFLGNCDLKRLRNAYGNADICVFPTLADEWGLVPIEAMASGIPVLGSIFAQSVETVVEEGSNGWVFDPTDTRSTHNAIDRAMACTRTKLLEMGDRAKASVAHISPLSTADNISQIITNVLPLRH